MKVNKINSNNKKNITNFINAIYTDYIIVYKKYIKNVINKNKENRLNQILDFVNTWQRNIMNIANDYNIIRNIITFSNDISVHKNGKYTFVIEVFDIIDAIMNCQEFGSFFSIYDHETIISAGLLRYSYIQQLVICMNNTAFLYNFNGEKFIKISKISSPNVGETYFITDGKNISYTNYGIYQFVDKLKSTHTLAYSKSIVHNFFHILMNGGVFLSTTEESGSTDIKFFFHAIPIAFISKICGLSCYSDKVETLNLEYPEGKRGIKSTIRLIYGSNIEMGKYSDIINPCLVSFD